MAGGQQFKKRLPMSIKNKYHFTELNEAQIDAVKTVKGPLLVLAGAGTGKTRVLTSRLSYILQNNIAHPSQICTVTFTITAGSTQRVFVARTNHSVINSTTIPTASFIIGTTNYKHGHIRIDPIASNPELPANHGLIYDAQGNSALDRRGFRDVTSLNFWGAIVIEPIITGFAMEFIGDMHDSAATSTMHSSVPVSGVN